MGEFLPTVGTAGILYAMPDGHGMSSVGMLLPMPISVPGLEDVS